MVFSLKLFSKDKTLLNNFLLFVSKLQFPVKIINNSPKFQKKKFLTVLKSPHVNKDAQEQFEFKIFSKELLIQSMQVKLLMVIFKKAIRTSFPGIKIQVSALINNNTNKELLLHSLNPNSYNLNFFDSRSNGKSKICKKVNKYLNLSDCYGEIVFKNNFSKINKIL